MRRLGVAIAVVIPALVVAARSSAPWADPAAAEAQRIRARLSGVERELRSKDVSALPAAQRGARARGVDILHAYWTRGVFPKNTGFPGERLPYFVDRYGTRCAMAYLIEQSGRGDLVARVAAANNNARIRELQADPELAAWLQENGLTAAEAARIQPAYDGPPTVVSDAASVGYRTTTGVAVGANVVSFALNAARGGVPRRLGGMLGIATGLAGLAAGAPNLDESGSRRTLGFVNAGVGTATALFGVYRLAVGPGPGRESRASLASWLDARGLPGLGMHVRF